MSDETIIHCPECFKDLMVVDPRFPDRAIYVCPSCGLSLTPHELTIKVQGLVQDLDEFHHREKIRKLTVRRIWIVAGFAVAMFLIILGIFLA